MLENTVKKNPYIGVVLIRSEIQKNIYPRRPLPFFPLLWNTGLEEIKLVCWDLNSDSVKVLPLKTLTFKCGWLGCPQKKKMLTTEHLHFTWFLMPWLCSWGVHSVNPLPCVCTGGWWRSRYSEKAAAGTGVAEGQRRRCLPTETLYVGVSVPHSAASEGKQVSWKVCPFCMQEVYRIFHGTWTHPQNSSPERSAVETCRDNRTKSISFLMVPHRGNKPCLTNSRNANQYCSVTGQVASWEANHILLSPFTVAQGGSIAGRAWHLKLLCWGCGPFLCCEDWCTRLGMEACVSWDGRFFILFGDKSFCPFKVLLSRYGCTSSSCNKIFCMYYVPSQTVK